MIEKSPNAEIAPGKTVNEGPTKGQSSPNQDGRATSAKLFEVEIAGVPLRLKSSHDEQTVNELVELVDRKVREALPLTKTGSIQNASILASLHLAEEYLTLRRKAKAELERLESRTLKVISELESSRMTGLTTNKSESNKRLDSKDAETTDSIFDKREPALDV